MTEAPDSEPRERPWRRRAMRSGSVLVAIVVLASCGAAEQAAGNSVEPAPSSLSSRPVVSDSAPASSQRAASSTALTVAPTTVAPPDVDGAAGATPDSAHPGDRVTLTPGTTIERNCTDIVGVYDLDGLLVGQILGGGEWAPAPSEGAPPTWPACAGTVTDASFDVTVPALRDGGYRFCLGVDVDSVGCATVTVSARTVPMTLAPGTELSTGEQLTVMEPGRTYEFDLATHCGAGFLSWKFNGQWWRTPEAGDTTYWLPPEWSVPAAASGITVELTLLHSGDTLTVTFNDYSVVYVPTELRETDYCA